MEKHTEKPKLSETGLPVKDIQTALESVRAVRNQMTFLKALTPNERVSLPRIRASSLRLMEDALQAARDNPSILPVSLAIEQYDSEVQACRGLHSILTQLKELCSDVQDTLSWHGSDANATTDQVRILVKAAAKTKPTPGMQLLSRRLNPHRRNAKAAPEETTPPANVPASEAANPATVPPAPAPVSVVGPAPATASGSEPKAA